MQLVGERKHVAFESTFENRWRFDATENQHIASINLRCVLHNAPGALLYRHTDACAVSNALCCDATTQRRPVRVGAHVTLAFCRLQRRQQIRHHQPSRAQCAHQTLVASV